MPTLLLCLLLSGDAVLAPLPEGPPAEIPASLRALASPAGARVSRGGAPFADLWFRAESPAGIARGGDNVLYRGLQPGGLVALVRFHAPSADYKGQKFPAGIYTLRYGEQPDDGDHHLVSEHRDFLILCPVAQDLLGAAVHPEALIKLSSRLNAGKHPSVLALMPPAAGSAGARLRPEPRRQVVVDVDLPLAGGAATTISFVLRGFVTEDEPADFRGLVWAGAAPDLKGKVALVRWWTNGCGLCETSAPVLRELSKKAAVVAVYHPKPPRDVSPEQVAAHAAKIGMPGTLAIDRDWKVLNRWRPPEQRDFTSLTFLLDRQGRIRDLHEGGAISEAEGKELSRKIDALLAEKE